MNCYDIINCVFKGTNPKNAKCQVYREQIGCWEYHWSALYHQMPDGEEKQKWRLMMVDNCPQCPVYKKHQEKMEEKVMKIR